MKLPVQMRVESLWTAVSRRVDSELFNPVDGSSLVFFRASFGLIMLIEVWRFFRNGWIPRYYIEPSFLFTYQGFEWVAPWPGDGMYWHFIALGLLALMIMLGAFYRLACVLFFFAFTYVFLLDQARYLNHFVLVILITGLMIFVPANRSWSVDAVIRRGFWRNTIPGWSVWLLRLQFEVMYIFAGLVKVNHDWLNLEPMGMWLARRDDFAIVGPLFNADWVVAIAAYGAIVLHVIGAPLLLVRRTRAFVMVVYFLFHLSNHFLFSIGIFPWITMAGTLMFLEPDWPRQFLAWLRRSLVGHPARRQESTDG